MKKKKGKGDESEKGSGKECDWERGIKGNVREKGELLEKEGGRKGRGEEGKKGSGKECAGREKGK